MSEPSLDEIGKWSETKLDIIREYAKPYSTILAKPRRVHRRLMHHRLGSQVAQVQWVELGS